MHLFFIVSILVGIVSIVSATPPLTRRACGKVGSTRCHGDMIQKCNQYHVWELLHACPSPMTCIEPIKGFAFCGEQNEALPSPTSTTRALKPTPSPQEPCSVALSTRCGGQFTSTVQQCGYDNRWHFQHECASDQVCSFHHYRARCEWLKPRQSSLEERDEKRDLDTCGTAYATRCHNNNIEYCEPWDRRWRYQSLCWTHDHQRCTQYFLRAVCENWGKAESALSIDGNDKPEVTPQEEKRVEKRDECGVFYATRCHSDEIQYCEPRDRQWHHQSDCKHANRQICMQYFNFAVCGGYSEADSNIPNGGKNPSRPPPVKRDEKPGEEKVEKQEDCGVFYSTRCHDGEIQYCEPRDCQWRHQSDCSCKEHKVCRQEDRWNAVCFVNFALCNGRSGDVGHR